MKNVFLILLSMLIVFSHYINIKTAEGRPLGGVPVIYWVSNPLPSRLETIREFQIWLRENRKPQIKVRLDTSSAGLQKTIMQGVTGTAADILSISPGTLGHLAHMGLLGEIAKRPGKNDIDLEALYPPLLNEIQFQGKIHGVPKGFGMLFYFVNLDLFSQLGVAPPPVRWTLDDFERIGIAFTQKANAGRKRQEVFFANMADHRSIRRTFGISPYNETFTACALNRPEYVALLKRIRHWTVNLHLLPTEADRASVVVEAGWGDPYWQLFTRGLCGVVFTGRHALVTMRQMKDQPRMGGCEVPNGGYPVATVEGVTFSPYRGTKHPEAVRLFFQFLFGEAYNMRIIREAEGCPPVAKYLSHPEFVHPPGHSNEWRAHEVFKGMLDTIGTSPEYSPYHSGHGLNRLENMNIGGFMGGVYTAEEATATLAQEVNKEIRDRVGKSPELAASFAKALKRQKDIDALRAEGKKVPLQWIDNPFLKRYYQDTGIAE